MILMTSTRMIELSDYDRISHLPDDVLCHVLSFVATNNSVATSVLSKRWNHLWQYVPKLTFHESRSRYPRFENFLDRALSLRTRNIQIGKLYDVTQWVSNSITRNIQSLELKIDYLLFRLPRSMFTCKTLESIMLEGKILLTVPTRVRLPKLRTLKLIEIAYEDKNCPARLISSCSSSLESVIVHNTLGIILRNNVEVSSNGFTCRTLEKLSLQGSCFIFAAPTICMPNLTFLALGYVKYKDHQIISRLISSCTALESLSVATSMEAALNISSSSLKVIELSLSCPSKLGDTLEINAPCLKRFKLHGEGRVHYDVEDVDSLEEAVVSINFNYEGISGDYCFSTLKNVYQAFRHVKSLKVHHAFGEVRWFGDALPMFNRLTELNINMPNWKCGVLPDFINNSTKLESLTLDVSCGEKWKDPICVPPCLLTSLRSVSIRPFECGVRETQMVKYILANARVLEKMVVCFDTRWINSPEFDLMMCKKIFDFRRGSGKCVLYLMSLL